MNNNPREMDDPTYGRQYGNRFSDPMDRERRNGGYGRDAMDSRNQRSGRENRQWGADRYESNPYGNRHFEDRGSEDRDRYTQDSTNRNAWNSGPTWNSSSNWSNQSESTYWPDRNDFENRDYNFRNYSDPNDGEHTFRGRRETHDADYGRSSAPDHRLDYENHNRQRYGQVFNRNDQQGWGSQSSTGSQSWGDRYQNRHFASGDRSSMGDRGSTYNDRSYVNQREPSGSRQSSGLEYGRRMGGQDLGGGMTRSGRESRERSYNNYETDQRVYDHGQFMSSSQYEHDRDSYGSIPGFGTSGQHYGKGPKGYKRADARIQEEVNDALYHDPQIDASEIEVAVKDGIVTLSGSVPERRMKRLAEECAERISGVQDVRNQISGGGFFSRLFEGDKASSSTSAGASTTRAATTKSDKSDKSSGAANPNMM